MKFITRGYNNIRLEADNGTVIKTSSNPKLKDEINYLQLIGGLSEPYLELLFPRLVRYQLSALPYQLELEFYPYKNLGNYITDTEQYDEVFWTDVLNLLFTTVERMKRVTSPLERSIFEKHCQSMFIEKTLREYGNLKEGFPFFGELAKIKTISINDVPYQNFEEIWESVLEKIYQVIESEKSFNVIHGDMCFSNILLGEDITTGTKTIKLIDPRGSFGSRGVYGTTLYDYAKLRHSVSGAYEFFIYDKFEISRAEGSHSEFFLKTEETSNKRICQKLFAQKFVADPKKLKHIKLIEGLIFIGMCARHYDSLERQKAMYLTGIKILNEVINENLC